MSTRRTRVTGFLGPTRQRKALPLHPNGGKELLRGGVLEEDGFIGREKIQRRHGADVVHKVRADHEIRVIPVDPGCGVLRDVLLAGVAVRISKHKKKEIGLDPVQRAGAAVRENGQKSGRRKGEKQNKPGVLPGLLCSPK